ncbi:MAG TPA: hypothetical protein VGO09_05320, partial [Flavisolibacter sp.]|nr:hypothetical protein [Flavisolibacter sp.]
RLLCLDTNRKSMLVQTMSTDIVNNYRSRYPVRYYLTNHLQLVAKFVFNNGSYHLPVDKSSPCYQPGQYVYKLFQSLLFFLCLVFGTAGLVLMCLSNRQNFIFLLPALYLILLFPVLFGLTEWRYFLPFYHFSQLGLIYLVWRIIGRFTL